MNATATITEEIARLAAAAQDALSRDFSVFAVQPREKTPFTRYAPHGFKSSTKDGDAVRKPYVDGYAANIGIDCGSSDIAVVDIDYGLSSAEELDAWMEKNGLPATLAVRTGKRTAFGVHLIYKGAVPSTTFDLGGCKGEVKSIGGYIIAAGSVHPDSLERYEILKDIPPAPLPEVFKNGKAKVYEKTKDTTFQLVPASQRNARLTSLAGTLRNQHLSEETIFAALKDFAINRCEDGESYFIQEEDKLRDLAHRAATKFDAEPLSPIVTIGNINGNPIPQGYCMTAEEWAAYDFSKEESESLIGTATNAIIRPLTKNLVLAPEKAFKTTFLMRLMAGLAAGQTIYDELPVMKPCKIVYFHAELNPAELQQRIAASVVDVDTQGRFIHNRDIRTHLINETGRQFIAETVQQYKPDVVVFDPWQDLIAGYDENSSKDTGIARAFMTSLIDTYKVTIFLVQHEGKDGSKGGRGHSSLAGWRDTLIKLTRKEGSNQVRILVSPRWGEPVTLELTLNDQTLTHSLSIGFTSQQSELRTLLKAYPQGATSQQIAEGLDKTTDATYKMVQRAIKDGAVIKNEEGLIFFKENTEKTETPMKGESQ